MAPVVLRSSATSGMVGVNVPVTKTVHKTLALTFFVEEEKEKVNLTWNHSVTGNHCEYSMLPARRKTPI